MEPIPYKNDINVFNSLDEQWAEKHFLGKNHDAATDLFAKNMISRCEDLMFMGPKAFNYYWKSAAKFFSDVAGRCDSDALFSFLIAVEFQVENNKNITCSEFQELASMLKQLDPCVFSDTDGLNNRVNVLIQKLMA